MNDIINCYFCNLPCHIDFYNSPVRCNNCSVGGIEVYNALEYTHIYHYTSDRSMAYHIILKFRNSLTEVIINGRYAYPERIMLEGFPISPATSLKTIGTYILLS